MYHFYDSKNYTQDKEYKVNRLLKLQEQNFKCEMCGRKAVQVHHKDKKKINHSLKNLMAVCTTCHSKKHSKFFKTYGFSIWELQKKFNKPYSFLSRKHTKKQLRAWIFLQTNKYPIPQSYNDSEKLLWVIEHLENRIKIHRIK